MLQISLSLQRPSFQFKASLALPSEGITGIYGPSGSGKTTLLRCIAGLERPKGSIAMAGSPAWQNSEHQIWVPTHRRELGYVFQEASLFEHLSVEQNLRYGLKRSGRAKPQALSDAIALLGIEHLLARRPQGLSGGERQRVAIARALATQPRLLLLDEPLASLDRARRQEILPWLERLHRELGLPMLYVTHTIEELARLADTVVLMDAGKVVMSGGIAEVLSDPQFAASAASEAGAILHGVISRHDAAHGLTGVGVEGHTLWVREISEPVGAGVRLHIHANDVSLARAQPIQSSIQNIVPAMVDGLHDDRHPSAMLATLRIGNQTLLARITRRAVQSLDLRKGDAIWAQIKSVALAGH